MNCAAGRLLCIESNETRYHQHMRIFFMDDAGNSAYHKDERYFGFGGFSIDSSDLKLIKEIHERIWNSHPDLGMPGDELKFSHVASSKRKSLEKNPLHRIGLERNDRRIFILSVLELLQQVPSIEVIVSVVDKDLAFGVTPKEHGLRTLLERIQHSASDKGENFLVICDEEQQQQKELRNVLHDQASFFVNYKSIQETIMFAPSVLSPGIQFADLIVGSTIRMMNYQDSGYFSKVVPMLRRAPWNPNQWHRYGVSIFPERGWQQVKVETGSLVTQTTRL